MYFGKSRLELILSECIKKSKEAKAVDELQMNLYGQTFWDESTAEVNLILTEFLIRMKLCSQNEIQKKKINE